MPSKLFARWNWNQQLANAIKLKSLFSSQTHNFGESCCIKEWYLFQARFWKLKRHCSVKWTTICRLHKPVSFRNYPFELSAYHSQQIKCCFLFQTEAFTNLEAIRTNSFYEINLTSSSERQSSSCQRFGDFKRRRFNSYRCLVSFRG